MSYEERGRAKARPYLQRSGDFREFPCKVEGGIIELNLRCFF
jgi:hypothetical protein